ncbi:MAG: DUF177 domain-containing protein [Deltaproteobacteria bacterium]|nr:DUF177 domain-containing protein [Deltaproteobacteria bacterium]
MKIKVSEILPEGLVLRAKEREPWFAEVLRDAFQQDYQAGQNGGLHLKVLKTCDNVSLEGEVEVDLNPVCSRCLKAFPFHSQIPIDLVMAPSEGVDSEPVEEELVVDDIDFSFYEGNEIDVGKMVREALVLSVPIRWLCREDCRGICPQCGQNLNEKICECLPRQSNRPLAVLKDFPVKKRRKH